MPFSRKEFLFLVLIMSVASFLRLYRIDDVPPALHGDTAYKGVAASRILRGEHPIFFEESWGGVEPMYMYVLAASFYFFGITPLVIKALSAILGIITVLTLYLLARDLLKSKVAGLLSSAWLAISYWHVSYSRLGWEIILAPLFVIITVYFLWRALSSSRLKDFVWAGLSLGAALYTYQAMRFLPILVALYLCYLILSETGLWRAYRAKLALLVVVAVLAFLPLGSYLATHPDAVLRRAAEVSIFNPAKNPEGPLRSFLQSAVKIIGMYNFQGDPLWRHNLPGRPAFDPLTSVCFLLGLGISVAKRREPAYSLLLFWLVILSLPPILTPPRDVPHFSRSIGALPAACIFPAIGVQGIWEWVGSKSLSRKVRRLFWFFVCILFVGVGMLTYHDYFVTWSSNSDLRDHYFDGRFLDVATAMNRLDEPEAVWILPISALASPHDEPGHHTIEFMYRGEAPFHFLRLDEETVAGELSLLTHGHARALVVDHKNYVLEEAYNYIDADPKRLVPFLLGKYGPQVEQRAFDGFDVLTYELPDSPDLALAESFEPASVNFGAQIMLSGVDYGGSSQEATSTTSEVEEGLLPSGKYAWVVLRWQSLADMSSDYKIALHLLDERGRSVGQVDKVLLSNHMHLTSDWEPGQVEIDYYNLPSLPATAPGTYHMEVGVYDPATMRRLPILSGEGNQIGHSHTLGDLEIIRPLSPPVVQPEQTVSDGVMVPEVRLLGYDLPHGVASPGEQLGVALYWQALRDVQNDYVVLVQVKDGTGHVWGEEESRPAYGSYPTTQWEEDEILRDWHDVPINHETPDGNYYLHVGLRESGYLTREVELGTIRILGRERQFAIPEIQHPTEVRLGEAIRLLGYDLGSNEVRAGGALELTLYWQALTEMEVSYTAFTHLLDVEERIWGQKDSIPGQGEAPTTSWIAGEIITDEYEIMVDPGASPGEYVIEIGMYDASTGQRLSVFVDDQASEEDRLLLRAVQVVP